MKSTLSHNHVTMDWDLVIETRYDSTCLGFNPHWALCTIRGFNTSLVLNGVQHRLMTDAYRLMTDAYYRRNSLHTILIHPDSF